MYRNILVRVISMYCKKCGSMFENDAKFCSSCGEAVSYIETNNINDENILDNNASANNADNSIPIYDNTPQNGDLMDKTKNLFKDYVGAIEGKTKKISGNSDGAGSEKGLKATVKCLPSFILGLIGGICGIFGGFCTTMCDVFGGGNAPFFFIFCGSIIGIIGACMCLSKARIGSLLELVSAIMIMICAYGITGSGMMSVIAMLMFLFGGIIGIVYSFIIKQK